METKNIFAEMFIYIYIYLSSKEVYAIKKIKIIKGYLI